LKNDFEALNAQKMSDKQLYEQEIKMLRLKIEELEEENEEYQTKLQIKSEIDIRMDEQRSHYIREIQMKSVNETENKLEKITKLISENATLDEKLKESESLRRKYQERHASQEDKIKSLIESNKGLQEILASSKKQLSDTKVMKSQNHKIYDEKIVSLTGEIEKLKKENDILKKSKQNYSNGSTQFRDNDDQVLLESVEAKPYLFGPVDHGKY